MIAFIKICLKIPPCETIVMHDKWMKDWFSKPCIHTLKEYLLYLVTLHSAAVVNFSEKWKKSCFGS